MCDYSLMAVPNRLAQEGEVIRCLKAGADDFINLPAEPSEIVEAVLRVCVLPRIE